MTIRTPRSPYQEAVIRARSLMGALDVACAARIRQALEEYIDSIERGLAQNLRPGPFNNTAARRLLRESRDIFRQAAARLDQTILAAIDDARLISFEETLAIWQEGALAVAARRGLDPAVLLGALRTPPLTMLGVWDATGSPFTWKTLLRGSVRNTALEAQTIMRLGMLEGIDPTEMSRRLRRYVVGSEKFQDLFEEVPTLTGDVAKIDLRRVPKSVRDSARQMRFNAERIAVSELHNARAEAETQHMIADPMVRAIRWRLSPVRSISTFKPPDQCDVLARSNFYGLGKGVYPVRKVPPPPHPFDKCEREPVPWPRDSQIGDPKPDPDLISTPRDVRIPDAKGLSPRRLQTIRRNTQEALDQGLEGARRARALPVGGSGRLPLLEAPRPESILKMEQARALRKQGLSFNQVGSQMNLSGERVRRLILQAEKEGITGVGAAAAPRPPVRPPTPPSPARLPTIRKATLEKMQIALQLEQEGLSRAAIASRLNLSQQRVGRLLRQAKQVGVKPRGTGSAVVAEERVAVSGVRKVKAKDIKWDDNLRPTITEAERRALNLGGKRAFEEVPEDLLAAINRTPKLRSFGVSSSRDTSWYNADAQSIRAIRSVFDRMGNPRAWGTFRHEYGHHLDFIWGSRSVARGRLPWSATGKFRRVVDDFRERMSTNDVFRRTIKRARNSGKNILGRLRASEGGTKAVSNWDDFFGSLTWDFGVKRRIGGGHTHAYYTQRADLMYTEMFANMVDIYARSATPVGRAAWEVLEESFPELVEVFIAQLRRAGGII